MNSSAKRLMAAFAVLTMIASAAAVVLTDVQDSSATDIDCTKYYYDQLESDLSKNVYAELANADSFEFSCTIDLTPADIAAAGGDIEKYNKDEVAKAALALGMDNPKMDYFYRQWSYSTGNPVTVTLIPFDKDAGEGRTFIDPKSAFDTEIETLLSSAPVDTSPAQTWMKIKNIHDYVADTLSYDTANANSTDPLVKGKIRSLYATLNDTYTGKCVVCEGYAKLFKALCDHYDIDCIIVTGQAGTDDKGPHMWNYVRLNEHWFLVDCTWDDQQDNGQGIKDTYLMAGTDKDGFNGCKVGASHDPCGTGADESGFKFTDVFSFPPLSALSINLGTGEVDGTQYMVTFKVDSETYCVSYVKEGEAVIPPENPTSSTVGWHFLKWVREDDSDYDMASPVLADLTLKAVVTMDPIWTLSYDTRGGTAVADMNVLQSDNVGKITKAVPYREGYVFKGWNTSSTGNGLSFAADDEIALNSDCTLYAIWQDSTSITYKIDSVAERAAVFLSEEMIDGVNNLILSIAVVTAAISLLAILAISRK